MQWQERTALVFAGIAHHILAILLVINKWFHSDLRLGAQAQTVAMNFKKVSFFVYFLKNFPIFNLFSQVFPVTDKLYVGLSGLASDVLSLQELLQFKTNLYKLKEEREIKPESFSALLSSMLYEKR